MSLKHSNTTADYIEWNTMLNLVRRLYKDGNYRNNEEYNLELLCPNCHSLTQSYKSLNNGNGRDDRYKNK